MGQAGREGRPRENPLGRPQDPSPQDTALLAPARPSVLAHSIVTEHVRCASLTQAKLTDELWALSDL